MATVTVSMRLPREEAQHLERLARLAGIDRAELFRRALRRGARDVLYELALQAYRDGQMTLQRAADTAGVSLREMMARMALDGVELSYGVDDLRADVDAGAR